MLKGAVRVLPPKTISAAGTSRPSSPAVDRDDSCRYRDAICPIDQTVFGISDIWERSQEGGFEVERGSR
jgi:hypothetical protein